MSTTVLIDSLDEFTRAYIEAALWSTHDDPDSDAEFLDENYDIQDISTETLTKIISDCKEFQEKNDLTDYPLQNAGHDFWMTRCGHGVGFWENDFGTPEQCQLLTESSKKYGNVDLYVGDNGKIYV